MKKEKEISLIRKSLLFMIDAHEGQYRKFSGKEYAHHPVDVAKIVRNEKQSKKIDEILSAALLHDTVEDCEDKGVDLKLIEDNFGYLVASLVEELTSDKDKVEQMGKAQYLLDKMLRMTSWALVIKLADRLQNCSDLANGSEKFRSKYVPETRYIINGLKMRYLSETHKSLIAQIESKISPYESQ